MRPENPSVSLTDSMTHSGRGRVGIEGLERLVDTDLCLGRNEIVMCLGGLSVLHF